MLYLTLEILMIKFQIMSKNSVFNKQKIMLSFTLVVIVKTFVLLISQANIFQKIGKSY